VAKKARTPDPPRRRVQAPKQRASTKGGFGAGLSDAERRKLLVLVAIAAVGLLGLVAVIGFFALRGGDVDSKASRLVPLFQAAGCKYDPKILKNEGRGHVDDPNTKIAYKTLPPTSGTHYVSTVPWGTYFNPLNEIQAVHNLEHGGMIVQYGSKVPRATIGELGLFVDEDPRGMLLAPLPALGNRIALTAWRRLATCTKYDKAAFEGFQDVFRGKGPERLSLDDLEPGE